MEGSAWYLGTNHRWTGTVLQLYWKETYWEIKDKDVRSGDMWMTMMKQDLCEDLCYCMLISTRKHSPWRGMEYWVGKMIPPVFVFSYPEYNGHLDRLAMMAEVEATQLAQWLSTELDCRRFCMSKPATTETIAETHHGTVPQGDQVPTDGKSSLWVLFILEGPGLTFTERYTYSRYRFAFYLHRASHSVTIQGLMQCRCTNGNSHAIAFDRGTHFTGGTMGVTGRDLHDILDCVEAAVLTECWDGWQRAQSDPWSKRKWY